MINPPFNFPSSVLKTSGTMSVPSFLTSGSHYSFFGIGGYMEVGTLSDLHWSSNTIPLNIQFGESGQTSSIILNNDNVSSGRRRLGMLVYVYETDQIYQFYIPNYLSTFSAATGSSAYTYRYVTFDTYETIVNSGTPETQLLINGWTGTSVDGVGGSTYSNSTWRKLSFSGSSSGGTISGGGTINYISKWTGSTSLGDSSLFDNGTKVVSSVQMDAPAFSGATIYLGLDSSGNTRTITADSVLLNNDILNGGTY